MQTELKAVSVPAEVVITIFSHLSISDALNLAAICRQYREIWYDNIPTIYKQLRRQIQCERYARILLADQGGLPSDSPYLTRWDVLRLRRNSRTVEKAIDRFNRDVVPHIRIPDLAIDEKYYGGQPRPCYLTQTETHRFTRSYYQVWSLLLLDPPSRQQRFQNMLLKHLYMVYEMIDLAQPIGDGTDALPPTDKRRNLLQECMDHLSDLYHHIHGKDYIDVSAMSMSLGAPGHIAMFDHIQDDLKKVVCYQWDDPDKILINEKEVWGDTSDEE